MKELVEVAADWRLLLLALLIFGVAPGVLLRVLVHVYPKDHPRREELVGELYGITMAARPFWVAQQLETALFEGIPARARRHRDLSTRRPLRPSRIVSNLVVLAGGWRVGALPGGWTAGALGISWWGVVGIALILCGVIPVWELSAASEPEKL